MSGCLPFFGFRRSKKVGGSRVTATHKSISVSKSIGGGLTVSSKRGLTWMGRKPRKKHRKDE